LFVIQIFKFLLFVAAVSSHRRIMDWNVTNTTTTATKAAINYPREASYFAAACAILFVVIGIGG